jgi:hypothetical protein
MTIPPRFFPVWRKVPDRSKTVFSAVHALEDISTKHWQSHTGRGPSSVLRRNKIFASRVVKTKTSRTIIFNTYCFQADETSILKQIYTTDN